MAETHLLISMKIPAIIGDLTLAPPMYDEPGVWRIIDDRGVLHARLTLVDAAQEENVILKEVAGSGRSGEHGTMNLTLGEKT